MEASAVWFVAASWAAVVSLGLMAGALFGIYGPFDHPGIARIMAAGAGLLMAAATLDLVATAARETGAIQTGLTLIIGAAVYSGANAWLASHAAKHRKRCGGCVEQANEKTSPGSGLAIALGTILDGIPEGAVLGLETARSGAPGLAVIAAFTLGNFAEATSSTSGMDVAGRSKRYILTLWSVVSVALVVIAGSAAAFSVHVPRGTASVCNAFAAGALIAMIVETMIPEAAEDSLAWNGVIAAAGFMVIVVLLSF